MRAFLAIKYYDTLENKALIEQITKILKTIGIDTFVFTRDVENYKVWKSTPQELMQRAFQEIDNSDILIIEATEPSIGIGIESGYAYTNHIPIYLIANKNSYVSNSIKGIATECLFYEQIEDLTKLKNILF